MFLIINIINLMSRRDCNDFKTELSLNQVKSSMEQYNIMYVESVALQ